VKRIRAIGHGNRGELGREESLDIARDAQSIESVAMFTLFFANRCTTANLSGTVADAKVVMNPWFHANCGIEFKASWMAGE
jgi:hypothetical protein